MNKKFIILLLSVILILSGCSKTNKESVIKEVEKKYLKQESYGLMGLMYIVSNEDKHTYDVEVVYKKDEQYKVKIKNKINNHEQIILRNNEGVYVLTPSINKSFKFQSQWPYNNSQTYLIKNIVDDIVNDKKSTFEENKNGYIYTSKVNYSNNKKLIKQKVYIDKKYNLKKVEVFDIDNNIIMCMDIKNVEINKKYNEDYFKLETNMELDKENVKSVSSLEDIIYPLYMPANTYLENKETVNNGRRVILSFTGDKNFTLIEEASTLSKTNQIVPVFGEIQTIGDVIGTVTKTSVQWSSNGIDYYLTSSDMTVEEMTTVANSITILPVSK